MDKFYSVQCLQTGRIMASGRNSTTEQSAINGITEYLNSDNLEDDEPIPATLANIEAAEFKILEHEDKIEDDE